MVQRGAWLKARTAVRAEKDLTCSCALLIVHFLHATTWCRELKSASEVRRLVPLGILAAASLASVLLLAIRRDLYIRCRPWFNVMVRVGLVASPLSALHAAYRANIEPAPSTSPLAAMVVVWHALLTSRAFTLFVPAFCRRMSLVPQVGLSVLCFAIAARDTEAICSTPLMRHGKVNSMLYGVRSLGQVATLLAAPMAPLLHMPSFICREAVIFLQLTVGVLLPSLIYLWEESVAAASFAAMNQVEVRELGWELRFFLWLHKFWASHSVVEVLTSCLVAMGACWLLALAL